MRQLFLDTNILLSFHFHDAEKRQQITKMACNTYVPKVVIAR